MSSSPLMVGLGEVLWDLLPSGRVLGGAPTNFAYIAALLGNRGIVSSRVGHDALGREACQVMEGLGLDTSYIQYDDQYETGTASVSLDGDGQPAFTIAQPVAWDFLEWNPEWKALSTQANVICFGSLAWRSATSAQTIELFLQNTAPNAIRICDANLREPFYNSDTLRRALGHANILKINDQELTLISSLFGVPINDQISMAKHLLREFRLDLICVTKGARGSLLVSRSESVIHPGFPVTVSDAVGAGDAFTACVAHYYSRGRPLQEISDLANRFASWIATQVGATPQITSSQLLELSLTAGKEAARES